MATISYTQVMSRGFAAFLCTVSLWSAPAKVEAMSCEDNCCDGGWWSGGAGRTALIIGGAAVVGGIAGAIAGNASGKDGHDGRRGSTGATGAAGPAGPILNPAITGPLGPDGLPIGPVGPGAGNADVGQALSFAFGLTAGAVIGGTATIIPFVVRPDGVTVEGPPVVIGLIGIPDIAPIVIANPVYGTYHAGIQIINEGLITVGLSLTTVVGASRDGSLTSIGTTGIDPAALITIPGVTQGQTTNDFSYDPFNIP